MFQKTVKVDNKTFYSLINLQYFFNESIKKNSQKIVTLRRHFYGLLTQNSNSQILPSKTQFFNYPEHLQEATFAPFNKIKTKLLD